MTQKGGNFTDTWKLVNTLKQLVGQKEIESEIEKKKNKTWGVKAKAHHIQRSADRDRIVKAYVEMAVHICNPNLLLQSPKQEDRSLRPAWVTQ
jgi:hypothetical protein